MVDVVVGRSLQSSWRNHDPRHLGGLFHFIVRLLLWVALLAALSLVGWGLTAETRTSYLQARIFSNLTRAMSFVVRPGPTGNFRFPKWGPYDERLGYAGLPGFIASLNADHFTVQRQAEWSGGLARFVDQGNYAIYAEKPRAGL